ncbi:hypothetical protein ABG768_000105 [Culter alburnus]|uniref:Ig-like domain-containing protein n=1 Tax=Culter alburnus TaxID=194366 RepID=A0AAW2B6R3_CULAL
MIFQYSLLLIFCGFAALSVSTETCGKDQQVGTSCIMKLPEKYNDKSNDIKWAHSSSYAVIKRRDKKMKSNTPGLTMEEDGSLRFQSVSLKDTGTYTYTVVSSDGTEIGKDKVEIKVYEKVPKPTVKINCTADGNATLTCDVGNSKDPSLTVSWYEDGKLIQNEKNPQVFLSSTQVQENKPYSCETRNPVSRVKSENVTVSCEGPGLTKLFGFNFWILVGILSGGSALLLLLICVFIICVCRICLRCKKHQQDPDRPLGGNQRTPIPQENPMPCSLSPQTPPQTLSQENLPPIPRLRNKQHQTKRNPEPILTNRMRHLIFH